MSRISCVRSTTRAWRAVLERPLLGGLELVVDDEHLCARVPVRTLELRELALPEVGPTLRPRPVLDELADWLDEGGAREFPQLGQLQLGIDSLGQHGGDEPALQRGVRLEWDHTTDYAGRRAEFGQP